MTIKKMNQAKILTRILTEIFLSMACWGAAFAQASVPSGKTTVVYFGTQNQEDFDKKIKPVFESQSCKNCELVNYTPYTKEGVVDMPNLQEKVSALPETTSFLFFDFNMKANENNKNLVEILNKKVQAGLVIVGSAGAPKANETSSSLSHTVLGQVQNALIIGELGERDRLVPTAFYGPEMLTALRPPKDKIGQGYSPLIFAASLAGQWSRHSSQEWTEHFKNKKSKSRKLWLDLNDMF